jgi:hypothetical protein
MGVEGWGGCKLYAGCNSRNKSISMATKMTLLNSYTFILSSFTLINFTRFGRDQSVCVRVCLCVNVCVCVKERRVTGK